MNRNFIWKEFQRANKPVNTNSIRGALEINLRALSREYPEKFSKDDGFLMYVYSNCVLDVLDILKINILKQTTPLSRLMSDLEKEASDMMEQVSTERPSTTSSRRSSH